MSITGPKSRGNFHIGWSDEQYAQIFGHKGTQIDPGETGDMPKTKLTLLDQPKMKEIIKIGKEINHFKAVEEKRFGIGTPMAKEVDRRFKEDTEKIFKPKENTELNKRMAMTYVENYKKELARRR